MNINQDNQIHQTGFKSLSIIVAADENNAIGKNNHLLWHLPNDLKFFKKTTSGHTVIMGRKTYDSIGKPLPNRRNIVITRNPYLKIEGVEIYHSIEKAIENCETEKEVFIIGGAEIYNKAFPLTHKVYLTRVHQTFDADTHLKNFDLKEWNTVWQEKHLKDEKHAYDYTFLILEKA